MRYAVQILLCFLLAETALGQVQYRPNREYRSLNTESYEIAIQKNGELDVSLASGEPVFIDAFPMVWIDGERGPSPMTVKGNWSERFPTRDALGEGNGMALRRKECTWSIRTYPTKPFMAVQVAYENTGKKPVTIRALLPWCTGDPHKGLVSLGTNTADSVSRTGAIALPLRDTLGEHIGGRNIAIYNPDSGRSLVAGFLTQHSARAELALDTLKPEKTDGFDHARFTSYFDPPVILQPGETLESDVLYLGIVETDPVTGLERFVRAVQAVNAVATPSNAPAHHWMRNGEPLNPFGDVLGDAHEVRTRPPRPLDLFTESPFQTWVWTGASAATPGILALTNAGDAVTTRTVPLNALGLVSADYYHMYDIEQARYLGVASRAVSVELRAKESRSIHFTPRIAYPQVLLNRTNPFEAVAAEWDGAQLTGNLTTENPSESLLIVVPNPYHIVRHETRPGTSALVQTGDVFELTIDSNPGDRVEWSISFQSQVQSR